MILERWLWKGIIPLAIGALIFLLGWSQSLLRPAVDVKKTIQPEAAASPRLAKSSPLVGTPSCTHRGCHGSIEPIVDSADGDRIWQNEYRQWAHDPHANSSVTLFSDRSQSISKLLAAPKHPIPAHQDPRCLACHANPQVAMLPAFAREEQSFGIGCESCHGNAQKWLVPHTDKAWRKRSSEEKWDQFQMLDMTDLAKRAQTCAGCHVGAPPLQDVNHDLIAAGHPRLSFELGVFQANMPAHWREKKISEGHLWAVGQIASAQAALELLIHRAESGKSAPWPEFAEYDCFACHHSLSQPSWRQTEAGRGRKPGALPWGSWHFALTPQLVEQPRVLDELTAIMQRPYPDPLLVAGAAKKVRTELQKSVANLDRWKNDDFARKRVVEFVQLPGPASWDRAEQLYFALHAVHPAPALNALAIDRGFPPKYDSPGPSFHPRAFIEKLRALSAN